MEYVPTIGLEIHAELKTKTKMFCSSKNDPDETRPNVNVCPVCMAHPGVLPVINREAVRHVLRVGVALGARLADYTEFDRKNYFYPDLPKGYQLSQYEYPLVSGGELQGVAITRVHLEEDTASSIHPEGKHGASYGAGEEGTTVIDFNRAGIPLMELVTEPVITSSKQAGDFARELQLLLRHLGVSEANMEKGEMRVEANVSVSKTQSTDGTEHKLGTKVEIKNLNSFRAMERAVEYEINRQTKILERGEKVVQETLGWDEAKQATFPQRTKEGSADYRYFPDPDLPSLKLSEIAEFSEEAFRKAEGELPEARRARYLTLGIKPDDAELYIHEPVLARFFEGVEAEIGGDSERLLIASNYIANDLVKIIRDIEKRDTGYQSEIPISALYFKRIIDMVADRSLSSRAAKDVLLEAIKTAKDPQDIINELGLAQKSAATDIEAIVATVMNANQSVVADYKSGKAAALEYLVGQCMKQLRGAADPVVLREILKRSMGQGGKDAK